jgi:hypothetical protein
MTQTPVRVTQVQHSKSTNLSSKKNTFKLPPQMRELIITLWVHLIWLLFVLFLKNFMYVSVPDLLMHVLSVL